MAKVGDLIAESVFTEAEGFKDLNPEISVILPTFRRGDNGLFQKCVDSLLAQTFKNFELIIIDDASVDSTAEHIRNYMAKDPRVSVIRHPRNIGLPAVSEIEGFLRARGEFYLFAFDDNEYNTEAVGALREFFSLNPDCKIAFAGVTAPSNDGKTAFYGCEDFDFNTLYYRNYLPNSVMMVRRELIDEFGVYDPHISMTRLCDWDLWCRIAQKYSFGRVDRILAVENGMTQPDSLCNSYPMDFVSVRERMNFFRNDALKLDAVLNYEVDDIPLNLSRRFQQKTKFLAETKFAPFFWSKKKYSLPAESGKYLLAVVNGVEASTDMFTSSCNTRIICVCDTFTCEELSILIHNASGVIFSRYISENYIFYAEVCRRTGTPYYYYTDDNFFELGMQKFDEATRQFLNGASGFLFSTPALSEFFAAHGYACGKTVAPVVWRPSLAHFDARRFEQPHELRFLYASNMRMDGLAEFSGVLKKLGERYKLRFYLFDRGQQAAEREAFIRECQKDGIEVEILKGERSYEAFLGKITDKEIHFVLHPAGRNDEFVKNCKYKTLNFMAVGAYASAFVFVPDVYPFSRAGEEYGLSGLVYRRPEEIEHEIEKLLSDKDYARRSFEREVSLCAQELSGSRNEEVFSEILSKAPSEKICFKIRLKDRLEVLRAIILSLFSVGKFHKRMKRDKKFLKRKLRFFKICQAFSSDDA